jgi:hypothetical protein
MAVLVEEQSLAAPSEIQVIPAGYHTTPKGNFLCDNESAALVLQAFAGKSNDMVIDYEHQTLEGCQAPAAGWIKSMKGLVNRGTEGIWAVGVEWTDRARQLIANREYRYLSPVFLVRKSDNRVTQLINVALTNQPNIDGMVPLINKGGLMHSVQMTGIPSALLLSNRSGVVEDLTDVERVVCKQLGIAPGDYRTLSEAENTNETARLALDSQDLKMCHLLGMEPVKYLTEVKNG